MPAKTVEGCWAQRFGHECVGEWAQYKSVLLDLTKLCLNLPVHQGDVFIMGGICGMSDDELKAKKADQHRAALQAEKDERRKAHQQKLSNDAAEDKRTNKSLEEIKAGRKAEAKKAAADKRTKSKQKKERDQMGDKPEDHFKKVADVWKSGDGCSTWNGINNDPGWSGRNDFCAVSFGSMLYLMGGWDDEKRKLNDIWVSPNGKSWIKKTEHAGWCKRCSFQAVGADPCSKL
jgi:hypothetical protein